MPILPSGHPSRRPQLVHNLEADTELQLPLSTLHERRHRRPCKTRFRLAGCASTGRVSNPLGHFERFQVTFPFSFPGLFLSQGWSTPRSRSPGEQVLRYLSRYTHRVAISNRRLVAADANAIAFRWKDYRIDRPDRWKTMTLSPHEFIRRFVMHVLRKGFHRIRHYGVFAKGNRAANVARSRELLSAMPRVVEPEKEQAAAPDEPRMQPCTCPRGGARMIIIEVFARGCEPRYRPAPAPTPTSIDTS